MTAATTTASIPAPPPPPREPSEYEAFHTYVTSRNFLEGVGPLVGGEAQAKTFVRVVLNAIQKNRDLLSADRKSLLLSCMQAARDKLMPDGKEAVLNIYKTKRQVAGRTEWVPTVQYLPMVAGLIKKLYESGAVLRVDAHAVYANDVFDFELGDNPFIKHKPNILTGRGAVIAAYVIVKLANGEIKREVVGADDIKKIREASSAPDSPAWRDWPDQMAIKAVIKRVYKQLPSSLEVDQVIAADNDALGFAEFGETTGAAVKGSAAVDAINASVSAGKEAAKPALEHNPVETVPPPRVEPVIEGELVTAGGEAPPVVVAGADAVVSDPPGSPPETKAPAAPAETKAPETPAETKAPKDAGRPTQSFATVSNALNAAVKAKSLDKLDEAASMIDLVALPEQQQELVAKYRGLRAAMEADDGK